MFYQKASEQMSQNPGKVSFVFFTEWYRPGLKWFQSMTKLRNFQKFEIQEKRKCEFLRFVFNSHAVGVRYCVRCRCRRCVAILAFLSLLSSGFILEMKFLTKSILKP